MKVFDWIRERLMKQLAWVVGFSGGGVHKRIDENRELLELLQDKAPEFLQSHPWVNGWLRDQDDFLVAVRDAVPIIEGRFLGRALREPDRFPRPWPEMLSSGKYVLISDADITVLSESERIRARVLRRKGPVGVVGEELEVAIAGQVRRVRREDEFVVDLLASKDVDMAAIRDRMTAGMALGEAVAAEVTARSVSA